MVQLERERGEILGTGSSEKRPGVDGGQREAGRLGKVAREMMRVTVVRFCGYLHSG